MTMFRNATLFRFPLSLAHSFVATQREGGQDFELQEPPALALFQDCTLKPVGALELSSRGFVSPYGQGQGDHQLIGFYGDYVWVTVGGEDKILPPSVVNRLLGEKLDAIEAREGRKPGGRTRKRIKEDLVHELLPKALVKPSRTDALLDLKRGFIAVDTASRKQADMVVSQIRHALGSFPALPLNAEVAPRAVMTGWLSGSPLPEHLTVGEAAILKDAHDHGGTVKLQDVDLWGTEVVQHLEAGKQVARLRMYYEGGIYFTLGEDLVLRSLSFGDELLGQLESTEREDLAAELDARFIVMSAAIGGLFDVLEQALTISKAEG
jgi:recombination associated protein RdgC